MITVEYDPMNGLPVRDGDVALKVADIIHTWVLSDRRDREFRFSTENVFLAIEVAVKEGRISHEEIQFAYNGKPIQITADGHTKNWSADFMTFSQNLLMRLL